MKLFQNKTILKTIILLGFVSILTTTDLLVKEFAKQKLADKESVVVIDNFWEYRYATNDDIGFSILRSLSKFFVPKRIKADTFDNKVLPRLDNDFERSFLSNFYMLNESSGNYELTPGLDNNILTNIMHLLGKTGKRTGKWLMLIFLQGTGTIIVTILFYKTKPLNQLIPLALIVSGALGNVLDRIIRGYVVDYILWHYKDIYYWPTFNLADTYTVCGATLLVIVILFFTKEEKKITNENS